MKKYVWFDSSRYTKKGCPNLAMIDKNFHRVGVYTITFHADNVSGYSLKAECVNCKKQLKYNGFLLESDYKNIK